MSNPSEKPGEPKAIDVELVRDSAAVEKSPVESPRTFFHPLSGLTILLVDWLAFGLDVPTGFLFLLVTSLAAFAVTFAGVYWIQRKESADTPSRARWKALLGAIAAGVPFPVTGTVLGAGILLLSGLPSSFKLKK